MTCDPNIRRILRLLGAVSASLDLPREPCPMLQREDPRKLARAQSDARAADADAALRIEVVEALVAAGVARSVALERTNSIAKMLAEGERLGVC